MFQSRLKEFEELVQNGVYTLRGGKVEDVLAFAAGKRLLQDAQRIYVIGSSALASHFCSKLIRDLSLRAHTLIDPCQMNSIAEDQGFDDVYAVPLQQFASKRDLLIAISSSGRSVPILGAAKVMKEKGGTLMTLSGFSKENPLRQLGDLNLWLGIRDHGLVEMGHLFFLQMLIDDLATWKEMSTESTLSA